MKAILRSTEEKDLQYDRLFFCCPGCAEINGGDGLHALPVNSAEKSPSWTWDGNLEEPTLSPSVLSHLRDGKVCHSFIRNGNIQFLGDSSHSLAGKTVPLPELPEWVKEMK